MITGQPVAGFTPVVTVSSALILVELCTYAGADHNISQGFSQAMARSVAFFDHHLKG
jgi:hypothetical protein